MTQQRRHFFLNIDDDVRLTQIFGQARILAEKFLDFLFQGIVLGLRPALLRSQGLRDAVGPLSPPIGQQRRVQTFAAEQSAQAASRRSSRFGLQQDALFVFSGVGTPLNTNNASCWRPNLLLRREAAWALCSAAKVCTRLC